MAIHYFNDTVQINTSLSKDEIEEINRRFLERPERVFRLYWFEENNDFSFLKEIRNVKKLAISYSKIGDFDFLKYINSIEYLDINEIDGNPDITPIGQLESLKTLNLNLRKSTRQNNLNCLNSLGDLEELYFSGKFKKNSLELNFKKLKKFGPRLNCVDINEISKLKSLIQLNLINQKVETLAGLEKSTLLNKIIINDIKINEQEILSPLFMLKNLETISLSYIKAIRDFTFIKDESPVKDMCLWSLNGLESIKGIEKLNFLEKYSQFGEHKNKNSLDFSALLKLKRLKHVEIRIGEMNKEAKNKLKPIIEQINAKK
jgi:hypothetical protein